MPNDKSPAFQHYPKDILSSLRVAMMTLEEEGAYRRALDFCWLNGSLPNDPEKLARVIGKGCSVEIANTVRTMFIVDKKNPQQIFHERLETERKKQKAFRQSKSKAGTASGISRRKKNKLKAEQVFDSVPDVFEQNANKTPTKGERKRTLQSATPVSYESKDSADKPPDVIWGLGVQMLVRSGMEEEKARSFLGGLAKQYGKTQLATAIAQTSAANPANPKEYLVKAVQGNKSNGAVAPSGMVY